MTTELDLKHYLSIIRKRLWLIGLIVVIGTAAAGVVSYMFMKPVYQAYTKLIVNQPGGKLGNIQLDLNAINTNISLINTYKEIIRTPAIMDLVVQEHPEFNVTAEELMRNVTFSSVNGTQVFTLTYSDTDYKKAALIVNAISEVFQEEIPIIMKVDNVYLLHMAKVSKVPAPVKPNPKLNMMISFVLSLLLGIGVVLLLDYFDDRIKTEADVEQVLGLPTLALIPAIRQGDLKDRRKHEALSKKAGETSHVTN
ncbi:YveK family protein [Paenibacillus sp. GCM10027626]|uniref:YveK family protein n=1 Tax=Paenibacillus sp. GCM10027626 TaxID=3273411 RepID=UPI003630ED05